MWAVGDAGDAWFKDGEMNDGLGEWGECGDVIGVSVWVGMGRGVVSLVSSGVVSSSSSSVSLVSLSSSGGSVVTVPLLWLAGAPLAALSLVTSADGVCCSAAVSVEALSSRDW